MIKLNFETNLGIKQFVESCVSHFQKAKDRKTIEGVLEDEINLLMKTKRISTIENYRTALRSLLAFTGNNRLFAEIDSDVIDNYQNWLKEKGIGLNTISCYMRSLRTIYKSSALRKGIKANDAFRNAFTGNAKTIKRSLTIDDITKIKDLNLSEGSLLDTTRDLFLFSFYSFGMPFVDVAHLKKSQIEGDWLSYYRRKTGQLVKIPIEPCMMQIIHKYYNKERDYIFPIMTSSDKESNNYRSKLTIYNRALKDLARIAGINCNITSYVVRHTWASVAFSHNVELSVISKALGHTNTETTMIYIREIDDERLKSASRLLLNGIGIQ
ncbi:MAG: site-specific integrase [Prevotella sp.]|nr:site-specific integrase [Prevotella sp.]